MADSRHGGEQVRRAHPGTSTTPDYSGWRRRSAAERRLPPVGGGAGPHPDELLPPGDGPLRPGRDDVTPCRPLAAARLPPRLSCSHQCSLGLEV